MRKTGSGPSVRPTVGGKRSRTRRWGLGLLGTFLLLGMCVALDWFALSRDPSPGLENRLPSGCGAQGDDFQVRCVDGIPVLMENGLPYPTFFDSVDHPIQSLAGAWRLRFDPREDGEAHGWASGDWGDSLTNIPVPSTYNAPTGQYRGHEGVVWFAVRFDCRIPTTPGWVRLRFDGVLLRCRVWLNGVALGEREGGFTSFYFDVTSRLRSGSENVLVMRADNRLTYGSLPPRVRPRHNPVWGVYGGVFRAVYLESLPQRYLCKARVYAYAQGRDSGFGADVALDAHGEAPAARLRARLLDPKGRVVGSADTVVPPGAGLVGLHWRFPLAAPRHWRPGRPEAYRLEISLAREEPPASSVEPETPGEGAISAGADPSQLTPGTETVWIRCGYRILDVTPAGLRMDGKTLFLKGISKMEDDPLSGQTQSDAAISRDLGWIRGMNANYVRLAHYPHDRREVRAAGEMGLMLGEEIPYFHVGEGWSQWLVDFQGIGGFPFSWFGMKQLHQRGLLLQAQKSLLELVERDGNEPAVILWSVGNESYSLGESAGRTFGWLRDAVRAIDPTRPVSMAEMTYYLPVLDAARSSARFLDVASLNMYYGWYFGSADQAGDAMDRFHTEWPDKSILISEFGAEAALGRTDASPLRTGDRVFFPRAYSEFYQAELLRTFVRAAWNRPFVAGVTPWCFADFYCPWFPHNPVPDYNNKGVLTRERVPKAGYYALREEYGKLPDFRP